MLFTSPRITKLCKYNDILHEKGQKTECIVTRSQKSPKSVTKEVENHKNMCPLSIPQNHKRVCFFRPLNHKKVYPSTQSHKRVYQKVYPPDPDPLSTPPSFCPITTCCPCIAAACTAVGATPAQTFEHLCKSELSKNKQAFDPQPGHISLISRNSVYTHLVVEEV